MTIYFTKLVPIPDTLHNKIQVYIRNLQLHINTRFGI